MSSEIGFPLLHWRTLAEMYEYYLEHTRSEDFLTAAEVIRNANNKSSIGRVAIPIQLKSGSLTPEKAIELEAEMKAMQAQAERMRRIAVHRMTQEAADGLWFAVGAPDGSEQPELIHPHHWNFLLVNCEQGRAWREPSLKFNNVYGALTKDLPYDHPLARAIWQAAHPDPKHRQSPLMVSSPSIAVDPPTTADPTAGLPRTGAPGRPSFSMPFIVREFEDRVARGELLPTVTAQAADLRAWFMQTHRELPTPSAGTIENRIRALYNQAKSAALEPTKL